MEYTPKKVFVLDGKTYLELSYAEFRQQKDTYHGRRFIPLHGMLMEVPEDAYKAFYKRKRREKYLKDRSKDNGDFSYDMLTTDDCIRKNPFNFALDTVIEDDRERKAALTPKQEENLLAFMEQDAVYKKYRDEVIILLGTGLRISEFCGLTTALDFKNRQINVDHQLLRDTDIGYYVETPKTKNGIRQIPMSEEV